jgi:signal transduction histidine kinase/CheY-like chemotaxis protein/streptogramin lyase
VVWKRGCGLLLAFGLICWPGAARAEPALAQARFLELGIAEGLSQSSVTALAQDHHGFLWIGTWDGLNRYDGHEFRVYRPDPDQPGSLTDSVVSALAVAPDGGLWVGTRHGGLNYYDRAGDRFEAHPSGAGPGALPGQRIEAIVAARDGSVWVATDAGVTRLERRGSTTSSTVIRSGHAQALAEGLDGVIWIGGEDGALHRYRAGLLEEVPLHGHAPVAAIRAILTEPEGGAWAATESAVLLHVAANLSVRAVRVGAPDHGEPARLRSLARDSGGGLWIGGLGSGLVHFDPATGKHAVLRQRPDDVSARGRDDVLSLFADREGTLWVGTLSGGLHRLIPGNPGFTHFARQHGAPGDLSHDRVTAFAVDPAGGIWVGTDGGGLNRLDEPTGRFEVVPLADTGVPGLARIWALLVDRHGCLWVGTWGAGLWLREAGGHELRAVTSVSGEIVTALAEDDQGLWVGSADRGLARLHHEPGAVPVRRVDAPEVMAATHVTALLAEGEGALWVGTWADGLARCPSDGGACRWLQGGPGTASANPRHRIRALARDRHGTLWLGTASGLARLDHGADQLEFLRDRGGLPAGTVYGVVEDHEGQLWLSSNSGLARFDPGTGLTRHFTPGEGVQDYEFNGGAFLRLPDGRALFGGIHGFNLVDPSALRAAPVPARVVITDFSLFGRSMPPAGLGRESPLPVAASELVALELAHRQNMLAFRFAAPLAIAPRQQRFAYRLDGFDNDWRLAGADERTAVYTNLAPGRYRLRARAAGVDGRWSEEERVVTLRILPPWWRSASAWLAYLLLSVALVVAIVQWRTMALRRHARVLQQQVRARTQRLAEQHRLIEDQARHLGQALATKEQFFARVSHEFRTPLTLIVGPIETLLANEPDGRSAHWLRLMRRNARRLLTLVDQLLGLSRLAGPQPVQLHPLPLGMVVRTTVAAFDSLASTKGIRLSPGPVADGWVQATPELLERIVTNLVSNAIKYTPAGGEVSVDLRRDGDVLWLRVSDTGPGIRAEDQARIFEPFQRLAEDGQGSGIGLALVRESVQALGGQVTLASTPGEGATFCVRLPACAPPGNPVQASDELALPSERTLLAADLLADSPVASAGRRDELESAHEEAAAPPAGERPQALVVEDNADLRTLLLAALQPEFSCLEASNGSEGIRLALEQVPDLVVSDVMMPGADGFEVVRILKNDPRTSHVPIILLTALGDRASRLQGLEERADDYLVKPFDALELKLRARNLVAAGEIIRQQAGLRVGRSDGSLADPGPLAPALLGPREQRFLERLRQAVLVQFADPATSTITLAAAVAMTDRQLQRKLRSLLNLTPGEYLREFRLQQAASLLAAGQAAGTVSHACGFSSQSHFGSCFKARFGVTPGEYRAAATNRSPG